MEFSASLKQALEKAGLTVENVDLIRINEAAPVIGDVAMEAITETIVTRSTRKSVTIPLHQGDWGSMWGDLEHKEVK